MAGCCFESVVPIASQVEQPAVLSPHLAPEPIRLSFVEPLVMPVVASHALGTDARAQLQRMVVRFRQVPKDGTVEPVSIPALEFEFICRGKEILQKGVGSWSCRNLSHLVCCEAERFVA